MQQVLLRKNGLTIGKPLTKEQIAKLDKDIVGMNIK